VWSPDEFLEQSYQKTVQSLSYQAKNVQEWKEWRNTLKIKLSEVLAVESNDKVDWCTRVLETAEFDHFIRERIEYTVGPNVKVPAYVLLPTNKKGPLPAIIACHGHGYGSREVLGLNPDGTNRTDPNQPYKDFALELVKRGFVVLVPEVMGFGDRRLKEDIDKDPRDNSCFQLATYLLMLGKTLAGQRVFEMIKGIDYLHSRVEVDSARIGCMGFSGGGQICAFTAALDERIRSVVVSGYSNTFKDSILSIRHCIDNYLPGIVKYAEMPDLIGLIAPRPLMIESGINDPLFPAKGAEEAFSKIKKIYDTLEESGKVKWDLFHGGHEVNGTRAFDWLESNL
jgi:dienelactone hydrolase